MEDGSMYINEYALHKMVESRLAELRAEAARRRALASEDKTDGDATTPSSRPTRWMLVQLLGR
jgi:hypothetical protein